ncbi:MAG: DUF1552 domain-containing protein [Polyangiaceae bacterium]|nr:DUF1552 domain-containing protein [Polyangiaceae bacterium]
MSRRSFPRRAFLRSATGALLGLPFLESVARGGGNDMPKRLVIYSTGEGNLPARWTPPTQANDALTLSEMLQPLAAFKDQMVVLSGVSNRLPALHTSNGHNAPGHTLLSGHLVDTVGTGQFDPNIEVSAGMRCLGPSIDHHLASRLGIMEPLNLAVGAPDPGENRMFYKVKDAGATGANPEAPLNADPVDAFAVNLGGLPSGSTSTRADRFRARRSSVLNGVVDSFDAIRKNVSARDKQRIEDHVDALRDLEASLSYVPPVECGGIIQEVPPGFTVPGGPDYLLMDQQAELMLDIMVNCLKCGARQIVTLQDTGYDGPPFEFLNEGPVEGWHAQIHNDPALGLGFGSNEDNPVVRAGFLHYANVFRSLLEKMEAVVEADGRTLLENSVVLWISEFGWGQTHDPSNLPIVLAGSGQGRIVTDRHLARPNATTNDLFVSLLRAFDVSDTTFGHDGPGLNNGPIPGLVTPA